MWSTVLVTALGSWEKTVSRGHRENMPILGSPLVEMQRVLYVRICLHVARHWLSCDEYACTHACVVVERGRPAENRIDPSSPTICELLEKCDLMH